MADRVKSDGRKERLAAALRENLKRRKARARALEDKEKAVPAGAVTDPPPSHPGKAGKTD